MKQQPTRLRKSSYSQGHENSDCVEAGLFSEAVAIGDTKNPAQGYQYVSRRAFSALIADIKRGGLR